MKQNEGIILWLIAKRLINLQFLRDYDSADSPSLSKSQGRVHMVVVACQGKTNGIVLEAATMIKSAMMFSTEGLNIHIFTDTLTEDFYREVILSFNWCIRSILNFMSSLQDDPCCSSHGNPIRHDRLQEKTLQLRPSNYWCFRVEQIRRLKFLTN